MASAFKGALEAHCSGYFKTATFSQGRELNNIVHEGLIVIKVRRALPLNTSNKDATAVLTSCEQGESRMKYLNGEAAVTPM